MQILKRLTVAFLVALWMVHGALSAQEKQEAAATSAAQAEPAPAAEANFPPEQVEQLVAPIALYPDALLAQILMASTYPLDIVQAARWQKSNPDVQGEQLEKATADENWDPSVKSLLFFPGVLSYMSDNLDWTQDLGDAVLGQQDDVTEAVQRLRKEAQVAGNLETTEQQKVETEGDTVIVQPADPEVVYVPTYNPSTVYGQTAPPATTYYPTTYTTPVATTTSSSTTDSLVSFGVGAAVGGLLTAAIMWNNNDYDRIYYGGPGRYGRPGYWGSPGYWDNGWRRPGDINVNRNVKVGDINVDRSRNVNRVGKWEHNPERRGSVRYRNTEVKNRYTNVKRERRIDRDSARGRDPNRQRLASRDIKRPQTREAKRPAVKRPQTREARRPDVKRPQTREARRPQAKKPSSRDLKLKAPKQTANRRAAAPKTRKPATRDSGRSSAFQKRSGGADRAASRRGAASRGGGHNRGGGGLGGRRG